MFVAVNYRDDAVFTFFTDCEMTIHSASLPLSTLHLSSVTQENRSQEFQWALQLKQPNHGISNMQIRAACTLEGTNTILVLATGSKQGMPVEIGGILLHF